VYDAVLFSNGQIAVPPQEQLVQLLQVHQVSPHTSRPYQLCRPRLTKQVLHSTLDDALALLLHVGTAVAAVHATTTTINDHQQHS